MKKKLLAILLAAIMLMTLLPTVAFAETTYITEVNVTLATDFANKTMTITPAEGESEFYDVVESFYIDAFDAEENIKYSYFYDGTDGEWTDCSTERTVQEDAIDMDSLSFIVWSRTLDSHYPSCEFDTDGGLTVNVNGEAFEEIEEYAPATGYSQADSANLVILSVKEDLPKIPKAKITGEITAADFAYKMVIPADTVLTEDDHKDVLLGGDGIVTIDVTKHGADNIDVFYTVDLSKGNLTDGETTITTTYGFSTDGAAFDALAEETEYTVYTGGEEIPTYVNVTANSTQWDAAPAGEYNATLVFNFDKREVEEPTTVADIASDVYCWNNMTVGASFYRQLSYEEGALNLVGDAEGKSVLAALPGTTVLTADGDNWTCTAEDVTYLFTMSEGELESITVSGMDEETNANGVYELAML